MTRVSVLIDWLTFLSKKYYPNSFFNYSSIRLLANLVNRRQTSWRLVHHWLHVNVLQFSNICSNCLPQFVLTKHIKIVIVFVSCICSPAFLRFSNIGQIKRKYQISLLLRFTVENQIVIFELDLVCVSKKTTSLKSKISLIVQSCE